MPTTDTTRARRTPGAGAFLLVTFAWSWSFFAIAIASGATLPDAAALVPWGLGALGPAVAAFTLTARASGWRGTCALARSTLAFREIGARWWSVMLALAVVPNAAAVGLLALVDGGAPDSGVADSGLTLLTTIGVLAFALLAGIVEEPGWRGFALERLGTRRSLLAASLLVGVGWALWHLPYFLLEGTFQNELGLGYGLAWFLLQIVPVSVLIAWVYVRSGHLVAAAAAMHALGNAAGELIPVGSTGRWLSLAILALIAAAVVAIDRERFEAKFAR
jgi:membrane protease YdiL (CAAX protease family)